MPCDRVDFPDGYAIICRRGQRQKACSVPGCNGIASFLCDFPLSGSKAGKTCSRAFCERHRTNVAPNTDHCPAHARATPPQQALALKP